MENYLFKAIRELKPESEFSFKEQDYSTIEWIILNGDAPTEKEISDKIKEIKSKEIAQAQAKAEAQASAFSKLAALGLTEEEIAALRG